MAIGVLAVVEDQMLEEFPHLYRLVQAPLCHLHLDLGGLDFCSA